MSSCAPVRVVNATLYGIGGAVLFLFLFILALICDGSWTFGVNDLSDLGVSPNPWACFFFNSACVFSGGLLFIFGIKMYFACPNIERYAYLVSGLSALFLMGIGLMTEDMVPSVHLKFAYIFFAMVGCVVAGTILLDLKKKKLLRAVTSSVILLMSLILYLTQPFEVYEPIIVMGMLVWIITRSVYVFTCH